MTWRPLRVGALYPFNPPKECALAAHRELHAAAHFGGCIHLKLDDFLPAEERRLVLRGLILKLIERKHAEDQVGGTGVLLRRLLDGELKTDASSPLDYMVARFARSTA